MKKPNHLTTLYVLSWAPENDNIDFVIPYKCFIIDNYNYYMNELLRK